MNGREAALLHRVVSWLRCLRWCRCVGAIFAALQLDRNVVVINDIWLITLDESETKTHAPLEILWPEELVAPLRTDLDVHRLLLSAIGRRGAKRHGDIPSIADWNTRKLGAKAD